MMAMFIGWSITLILYRLYPPLKLADAADTCRVEVFEHYISWMGDRGVIKEEYLCW